MEPSPGVPSKLLDAVRRRKKERQKHIHEVPARTAPERLVKYDFIIVFAGNAHCGREYSKAGVPAKYIHIGLEEEVIKEYWEWVDKQMELGKPVPNTLFIFDDVLCMTSSKKWGKTRT